MRVFPQLDLFIDRVIDRIICNTISSGEIISCLKLGSLEIPVGLVVLNFSYTYFFIYIDFQSRVATEAPKRETNIATIAPLLFSVRRHRRPARSGRKQPEWMYQRRGVMGFEGILQRDCMLLCKNLSNIEDFWLKHSWTFSFEGLCRIFGDW